jgi:hypothetical protein
MFRLKKIALPSRGAAIVVALLSMSLPGCGNAGSESAGDLEESTGVADLEQSPGRDDRIFDESVEDEECRVLTTEDVAAATGVPAGEIEQRAISGCLYSWDAGESWSDGSIMLMSVSAHETVDRATSYYARFTRDTTAEEIAESKDAMKDELAKKREEGELSSGAEAIGGALTEAMPEEDISHQRWSGIGSEASTDGRGSVRLRYGNVTAWFVGKTAGEDRLDDEVAREIGRRIVANLDEIG